MRHSIGVVSDTVLEWLLEGPSACAVWTPGGDTYHEGVLYRDPRWGLTVRIASSWNEGQTFGPIDISVPVLFGRVADGPLFALHDATVSSSLGQSEATAAIGYVGGWVDSADHSFDNLTIAIDELPRFLGDQTFLLGSDELGQVEMPGPVEVGAVTVTPSRATATHAHSIQATNYEIRLVCQQKHRLAWWLDQWVNPLTDLVSFSVGRPASVTTLTMTTEPRECGNHHHRNQLHITGQGWPTLDLDALRPTRDPRAAPGLLSWRDGCFDLPVLMRQVRKVRRDLDVPFRNYLATIYSHLSPSHEFLNLVQAAESLHSVIHGRYRLPTTSAEGVLDRLKEKGVNNKDRRRIKHALEVAESNEFTLAQRIAALRTGGTLPDPPSDPPPWVPESDPVQSKEWEDWIARARNDISHGNARLPDGWLRHNNLYLRAVVERTVLLQLGLSERHASGAAARRYRHTR